MITSKSIVEQILARAQYKHDMDGKVIQAGKFDQKSTAEEREHFLRDLVGNEADGKDVDDEDDDDLSNDDMNEMLARNEEELVIFKPIDAERFSVSTDY